MLFIILTCGQARSATTSIHSPENAERATAQRARVQAERRLAVGYEVARHCRRFRARPMVCFRHFQRVDRHKYRWFRSLASDCRHLDGYRKIASRNGHPSPYFYVDLRASCIVFRPWIHPPLTPIRYRRLAHNGHIEPRGGKALRAENR